MSEPLRNIDRFVFDELHDLNEEPKTAVWRKLEARLDEQEEAHHPLPPSYAKRVAALVLFLLLWIVIDESANRFHNDGKSVAMLNAGKTDGEKNVTVASTAGLEGTTKAVTTNFTESRRLNKGVKGVAPTQWQLNTGQKLFVANADNGINDGREQFVFRHRLQSRSQDEKVPGFFAHLTVVNLPLQQNTERTRTVAPSERMANALLLNYGYKKTIRKAAWVIILWQATEWTNYHLEEDVPDGAAVPAAAYVNQVQSKEQHEPSLAVGIKLERQLTNDVWLQSGLSYARSAIAIVPQTVIAESNKDGSIGYRYNTSSGYAYIKPSFTNPAVGDSLLATEAQHNLSYVQVPVTLQWKKDIKKFSFSTGAGIGVNILTKATLETEVKDASNKEIVLVNRLTGMKKMYADLLLNAGMAYTLNKNIRITAGPYLRTAVASINNNNVVKTYPYSFGLAVGCSYKF